jgi:hypothetical protein
VLSLRNEIGIVRVPYGIGRQAFDLVVNVHEKWHLLLLVAILCD